MLKFNTNNTIKHIFLFAIILLVWPSLSSAWDRNLPGIDLISREERWANETMRLESNSRFQWFLKARANYKKEMEDLKISDPDKYATKLKADKENAYRSQMANDYIKENYFDEVDLDWTNRKSNWEELRWPEYHKNNKSKIIIHHTASDNSILENKSDVKTYLSWVYFYHTITNGRWDIWYNFIIDPFGNIYEGRAGGEWVVWAHAKRNNTPSIWISLIWNFDIQEPTDDAVDSLIDLSTAIAKKYNINPKTRVDYHKDTSEAPYITSDENYAIAGHRDAGITSCPGEELYELLPAIRSEIENRLQWKTLTSASDIQNSKKTTSKKLTYNYFESIQTKIAPAIKSIKNQYLENNNPRKMAKTTCAYEG